MPDFETYLLRYGEISVQAIIEQMERYEGIRNGLGVPLEDRWDFLMRGCSSPKRLAS